MARELVVRLIGDDDSLRRSFLRSSKAASDFDKSLTRSARGAIAATVSFRGMGRALAFGSNAFLGGAGAVFAVKAFSEAASNMAEQTTKANVVFGASTRIVQNFANNALGLAKDEATQFASTFGALLKPLGLTGQAAAKASVALTQLGIDFASFFNTNIDDALAAIQSGLVGEVEPLRRYGVLLSQARVQQEALAESGKKSVKQLTNQEIVQARIALIFRDSAQAQGDFARTQGGLANQQRILSQNVRNLEISLGQALNPTILDVTKNLNKWLSDSRNQQKVTQDLKTAIDAVTGVAKAFKTVIEDVDKVTGGLKNTLQIIIGMKVASIVIGWAKAMNLFAAAERTASQSAVVARINAYAGAVETTGTNAQVATGKVNRLKGSLTGLGLINIAPILIPLEVEFANKEHSFLGKFGRAGSAGQVLLDLATNNLGGNIIQDAKDALLGKKKVKLSPTVEIDPKVQVKDFLKKAQALVSGAVLGPPVPTAGGGGGGDGGAGGVLTVSQRNTFFDNLIARLLLRGGLGNISQQIAALQKANGLIEQRLKVTKDVTRRLNLEDQLLQNIAQIKSLQAQQAADALAKRQDALSELIANLQLGVTKAQTTSGLNDDIAALKALQAGIRSEIAEFGKTADLAGQLVDVQQQLKQAKLQKITAEEFFTLGLSPTGDTRVPLAATLRKQLGTLEEAIQGTVLDTNKNESELSRIRKVLSRSLVPSDVRSKIKEMLDGIQSQLKDHANRFLPQFARTNQKQLLAGLGLTAEQVRVLRSRLSQVGPNGRVPIGSIAAAGGPSGTTVIHTTVQLDKQVVGKSLTKFQQQSKVRNPDQRRGLFPGGA